MKKISTVQAVSNEIFKEQKLTIGMDLGDRWSFYCVLDEAGKIILEQKVATTPEVLKQTFARIPRSLIALETGTHSPCGGRNTAVRQQQTSNRVMPLAGFAPLALLAAGKRKQSIWTKNAIRRSDEVTSRQAR
jgi:hypothetical protein